MLGVCVSYVCGTSMLNTHTYIHVPTGDCCVYRRNPGWEATGGCRPVLSVPPTGNSGLPGFSFPRVIVTRPHPGSPAPHPSETAGAVLPSYLTPPSFEYG